MTGDPATETEGRDPRKKPQLAGLSSVAPSAGDTCEGVKAAGPGRDGFSRGVRLQAGRPA